MRSRARRERPGDTVTDTETGVVRTYTNQQGNPASVADLAAFQ